MASIIVDRMFIVVKNGRRLCQDNLLRKFANFGTFPECVKVYKSYGWAEKTADKIGGKIVILDAESYMDASGDVIKV
jgi:hypothetical protein